MRQSTLVCVLLLGLVSSGVCSPIVKRQILENHASLDPTHQVVDPVPLNYNTGTGTFLPRAPPGTVEEPEDIAIFYPGSKVSLELPDKLFGSGFTLISDVSKTAGNLIQNSAERTARLFEAMKPFFKFFFGPHSLTITRDKAPEDNKV